MPGENIYSRFAEKAGARSDAPFLEVLDETAKIYGVAAGSISYGEMFRRVETWRAVFCKAGYGEGCRVGLLLENRPVFLEIWFALNGLGVSVVPMNPDLRPRELEYIIAHSEMTSVITIASRKAGIEAATQAAARPIPVMTPEDPVAMAFDGPREAIKGEGDAECALLYTSGTMGRPKACVLTNEYFLYSGEWYRDAGGLISLGDAGERMVTPLPVFHMNAMSFSVMGMVTVGGCLILLDRFHPRNWWAQLRESHATCLHYLGVMPSILMAAPASAEDRNHQIRFGFGAGVDRRLHAPFEERFGFPLLEAWSMTETGSGAIFCAHSGPRKIGTSCFGRASSMVAVRIVAEDGAEQTDGIPGELLVRQTGANPRRGFFREYLKDPIATAQAWQGGWFHTGDLVVRDSEGDLHFVDRKKNIIRRSGENIAAVEVENVLNRHPLIRQAGVVAVADAIRGEEVAALIVAQTSKVADGMAEAIIDWTLEQIAYYKIPGWIAFVEKIPLTATGKIHRTELKLLAEEKMTGGGALDFRRRKKRHA